MGRYRLATVADIDDAVACARSDEDGWRGWGAFERSAVLRNAAMELRKAWGDLIGAAMADGGKTIPEADAEVAEAIDFTEFYNLAAKCFHSLDTLSARGKGVVVVVPPWNFPIAIPCGGIAAALAAGNTVIIKPAPETTLVAWEVCRCFWRAGVSRRTLQFVPADEQEAGTHLVNHDEVDAVVLTGGTETARHFLRMKPGMRLLAETGGKNATIVTALSDRDQAIRNVLHSAFSHSGQKCSATSLLILEGEVYDDPEFKRMLSDAVRSLEVGSVWDLKTRVGPLIRAPEGPLKQALENLEEGESWALEPQRSPDNPQLVSPGVRWGVQPESFPHRTELFGPVLSVMRAPDLRTAVQWVNATGYGLTSGIETLDEREQEYWRERIRAGNLYINRGTTGAIVLRQPFGGFGKSSFGPGIKAGGPNYVAQLMHFDEEQLPETNEDHSDPWLAELGSWLSAQLETKSPIDAATTRRVLAGIGSAERWRREEFGATHDHFRLVGQDNLRRYLPVKELRIRVAPEDSPADVLLRVCMARAAECRQTLSLPEGYRSQLTDWLEIWTHNWGALLEVVEESDNDLAEVMRHGATDRLRYASPQRVPETIRKMAGETGIFIADTEVICEARVELLWYFEEQSISHDYHRYGNLGARAGEERAAVI